jgi:molybdopterin-guanine dinucleotide biosynthesis protein A
MLGAVLSGGHSTRMGVDKADVLIGEKTMLELVGQALGPVTDRMVLLGPDRPGWECWPDSVHAAGPLAGIATALGRSTDDQVLVVAVDHPFAREDTLAGMAAMAGDIPVVPVDRDGVRQVTFAVYPRQVTAPAIEEAASGGSIQSLLDRVSFRAVTPDEWSAWGEDGRSWFSVDDPSGVEEGLARFGT